MCRIAETSKKQLLICEVYWPNELNNEQIASPMTSLLQLDKFYVSEITPIRFNFNQQRAQPTGKYFNYFFIFKIHLIIITN